ncbi:iron complex transport system ATP-binding protein [Sinomicrobium oceani]|uniref:Iron complex transport system ATP-binding protein n=1 Tax=Sinomicrobium oceani TaxID=1150368 RepID=A0A1K1QBA7_9FLAO|nr:ABC transporter ATP-binding protein [Sinomicrobium oceani]SFW57234.1 iron complex transport system ATP-binding protein [Sinomicrobium oceani]
MTTAMTSITGHPVLRAEKLAIGYLSRKATTTIARDISFELSRGELTAVIGANGIGKSTLLRTLSKIQSALSGTLTLSGKTLDSYSNIRLAQEISLVLTEQIPSRNLTVAETIALGRQPYTNWIGNLTAEDTRKVREAITLLHLETLQHKKCYTLSDGQFQKVMIARAIAQDTSLVILDEPTTHLDVYHKTYILKLLRDLAHTTQKSILYSSHEIDLSIQLCDKMLVMLGQRADFGTPCELIERGTFRELFPPDLIEFDPNTGTFRIR